MALAPAEIAHRPLEHRMPYLGSDLGQRFQHKSPGVHGGCGMVKPLVSTIEFPNRRISISMMRGPFSCTRRRPIFLSMFRTPLSSCLGIFSVVSFNRAVQEPGLCGEFNRFSFVEGRKLRSLRPNCPGDRWLRSGWPRGRPCLNPAKDKLSYARRTQSPVSQVRFRLEDRR